MSHGVKDLLIFTVEEQRFAIPLSMIDRVIRAVALTPITDSPGFIEGIIDYFGEVIAVISLRKPLGYPLREVGLNDRFIIVTTAHRKLALIVDDVEDVLSPDSQDWFDSKEINKGLKFLNILRDDQGIIFIYDIESLLGMDEEIQLKKLLETNFFN
jgi:purine-binding chemotaxis protein CheW